MEGGRGGRRRARGILRITRLVSLDANCICFPLYWRRAFSIHGLKSGSHISLSVGIGGDKSQGFYTSQAWFISMQDAYASLYTVGELSQSNASSQARTKDFHRGGGLTRARGILRTTSLVSLDSEMHMFPFILPACKLSPPITSSQDRTKDFNHEGKGGGGGRTFSFNEILIFDWYF